MDFVSFPHSFSSSRFDVPLSRPYQSSKTWFTGTLPTAQMQVTVGSTTSKLMLGCGYPFSGVLAVYNIITRTWSTVTRMNRRTCAAAGSGSKLVFAG
jgi:hypothetical protein